MIQVLYPDDGDMVSLMNFTESNRFDLHELIEVHYIWSPGSVFSNPSLSGLLDCSPSFPSTGGPTGFSSVSGGKATVQSSVLPACSSCASNCSCSLLHSTPGCPIMYEAAVVWPLCSPPSTKPAPLYLCEAPLVSVPVRENQNELFNSRKTLRFINIEPIWNIIASICCSRPHLFCLLIGRISNFYWSLVKGLTIFLENWWVFAANSIKVHFTFSIITPLQGEKSNFF